MENDQAIGKSAITPFHANTEAEKKSIEKLWSKKAYTLIKCLHWDLRMKKGE